WLQNHNFQGDGAEQISFIIKDKMQNSDSLLVWHSRFEPYVYLKTLASTKFASSIFFKPDGSIQAKNTDKHLLQTYEKEFVKETNKSSPDWILLFKREGLGSNTFTDNYIRELLDRKYLFVKRLKGIDLLGKKTSWELYSLKN
ncbi:MAG: hypothetical protein KDD56_08620, partial [Bdellovibrionales bacterium]|nr:hypothetical protein [Bdellovibrionales bacterium]